jgi:hypothetical protein
MAEWKPLNINELTGVLNQEIQSLSPDSLSIWEAMKVPIRKAQIERSRSTGKESIFVVAASSGTVIYYDDVEDEFGVGVPDAYGCIQEVSLCGPLRFALTRLKSRGSNGRQP